MKKLAYVLPVCFLAACGNSEEQLPQHTIKNIKFEGIFSQGSHVNDKGELVVRGYETFSCRSEDGKKFAGIFTSSAEVLGATETTKFTYIYVNTSNGVYGVDYRTDMPTNRMQIYREHANGICTDKPEPLPLF